MDFHDEGHGYDVFGLHPPTLARVLDRGGRAFDRYFRTRSYRTENIPVAGGAILVANHGGALPIDAALLCFDVDRHTGRILRPLADRFVSALPVIQTLFARCGAVIGTRANASRLLERGELVAIWPEGSGGIGKSPRRRYQFDDWRVGHAELAIRHRVPVVPVAILGPEEAWPVVGRVLRGGWHGIPFLPVPLLPVPLPLRHYITYGAPIALHEGLPDDAADDPQLVAAAAARVRTALTDLIGVARMRRAGRYW